MRRIYLDYAATTPVDEQVLKAMMPYFGEKYGNAGSLHFFGQEAIAAIDKAREIVAKAIGAKFEEIIFTGSATEANNLALRGVVKGIKNYELGIRKEDSRNKIGIHNSKFIIPRIIVSAIEHESVLDTARDLEKEGVEVVILPVNKEGFVDTEKLKTALDNKTILVSVMYANNEIGVVQPIAEILRIVRDFRNSKHEARNSKQIPNSKFKTLNKKVSDLGFRILNLPAVYPLVHTDAVQAFQFLDCDVNKLGIDLMTLSAHKIYGPKGIGALYIRNPKFKTPNPKQIQNKKVSGLGFRISDLPAVAPLVTGGGQEFGFRSGTENVASIVGFAKAVKLIFDSSFDVTEDKRALENKRISDLRDYFWAELKKIYPGAEINSGEPRLPNILNVYFPGQSSEDLLIKFDTAGVAVSSGSACSARSTKPSHVLQALGLADERIKSSIRFSLGRFTTKEEIQEVLKRIAKILN